MSRYIVIVADPVRELFAAEDADGNCGVFWVISGPRIGVGDMLAGSPMAKGYCQFIHAEGACVVTCEKGPIGRSDARALVRLK